MPKKHFITPSGSHDYLIAGVVTTLPGFRLCYFLNKALGLRLSRVSDFISRQSDDSEIAYPLYAGIDAEKQINGYLISNKSSQYLVPSLRQFDFLLITDGLPLNISMADLVKKANLIPQIQFVQSIDISLAKGLDIFLEDFEMQLTSLLRRSKTSPEIQTE